MSRNVSNLVKQAINAQETGEVFIVLLTIDHPDLAEPMRLSSDAVDTVSRSNTYVAFPFDISLPNDQADRPPRAGLRIDNVDRQIVQTLRTITSAPTVLMEVVLGSDPDTVEASWPDFQLLDADYDHLVVAGELGQELFLNEPWPGRSFTPADFPGLF